MKNLLLILSSLYVYSCNTHFHEETPKGSLSNKKLDSVAEGIPRITYQQMAGVFAKYEIVPKSFDSVMATIDFINDSDSAIWLYKPILPTDNLPGNYFNFKDTNFNDVIFLDIAQKEFNYLFGNASYSPAVQVSDTISQNDLELLNPHSTISWTVNVAFCYNFKSPVLAGQTKFISHFYFLTPFIQNNRQLWKKDYYDSIMKPVFLVISSKDSPNNLNVISF